MRPEGLAFLFVAAAHAAATGFEVNGVTLGASEAALLMHFPNAHCQALQWQSRAADRRCDDSRVEVGGVEGSLTFYLKDGAVEAFDLRFDSRQVDRVVKATSEHAGQAPVKSVTEKAQSFDWRKNGERAHLSAQAGQRRASLLVWRGAFYDEIYKVR